MNYISIYSGTAFFYVMVVLIATALAWLAQHKKNYKLYLLLLVLGLSIILGFRGESVGTDTATYLRMARWVKNGYFNYVYGETGFKYLLLLIVKIFPIENSVLIVIAIASVAFFIGRLWELRNEVNFSLGVFIYTVYFYMASFNYSRQCLAIAILFWATRYLIKDRLNLFLVIVAICSLIHASSVAGVIIFIIYVLFSKKGKIRINEIILLVFISIGGIIYLIQSDRVNYLFSKYININNLSGTGVTSFFTLGTILIIETMSHMSQFRNKQINIVFTHKKKEENAMISNIWNENSSKLYITSKIVYFLGIIVSIMLNKYEYASRISLYFLVYEIIFWGYKYESGFIRLLKTCFIILLMMYSLFNLLNTGGYGIMPYVFFNN